MAPPAEPFTGTALSSLALSPPNHSHTRDAVSKSWQGLQAVPRHGRNDFFQDFKPPVSTQGLLPPGNTFHVTCQQYTRGKNKASRRGEADLGSGGFLTGAERKGKKTFSSSSRPGKQPFLDDGLGPAFPPGTSTCRRYISIYGRQMLLTSTIMTTEPC